MIALAEDVLCERFFDQPAAEILRALEPNIPRSEKDQEGEVSSHTGADR